MKTKIPKSELIKASIKASCGGQGCSVQPYILPYAEGTKGTRTLVPVK